MTELGHTMRTAGSVTTIFRALTGSPTPWLVAATLISLAIVMGFLAVMGPIRASINKRTDYGLIDLELAGAAPRRLFGAHAVSAETVLAGLKGTRMEETPRDKSTALEKMRTLQWLDVGFTLFYGISFLLLAALIWRFHPGARARLRTTDGGVWRWTPSSLEEGAGKEGVLGVLDAPGAAKRKKI